MVSLAKDLTWLTTENASSNGFVTALSTVSATQSGNWTGTRDGNFFTMRYSCDGMSWVWFSLNAVMISRLRQAS